METFKQKVRAFTLLVAVGLLLLGLIRQWGNASARWDILFLAGGGLLLGLALRSGVATKKPLPPAQPTPKSGA
jgi:di/tricarboxylate transporter